MPKQKPARKVSRLVEERLYHEAREHIYGSLRVLENMAVELEQANEPMAVDWLHRNTVTWMRNRLKALVETPGKLAQFKQRFPGHDNVAQAAQDLYDNLDYLESVRTEKVQPHLNPDGTLQRLPKSPHEVGLADRALRNGLTEEQQSAYEAQFLPNRHLAMSQAERQAFADVIRDILE